MVLTRLSVKSIFYSKKSRYGCFYEPLSVTPSPTEKTRYLYGDTSHMAIAEPRSIGPERAKSVVDIPDDREYGSEAVAELDAALEEAIEKADAAGHDYLSAALRYELGSLYLESELGV